MKRARRRLKGHGTGLAVIALLLMILSMMIYAVVITFGWR